MAAIGLSGLIGPNSQRGTLLGKAQARWSSGLLTQSPHHQMKLHQPQKERPQMINKLFNSNTKQKLTNFSQPTQEAKTMNNIETLQNEFNLASEEAAKATERFNRKKEAPESNLRSIADLKRFKLEMLDAEIAMHEAELELLAEREEVEQRENSVATAQVELDITTAKIKAGLDSVGINTRSCYRTSDTQAEIMLLNTHVKTSMLYKAAIEKLKQAGAIEHAIEQNARRVASALNAAQGKREDFFANERRGI